MYVPGLRMHNRCCAEHSVASLEKEGVGSQVSPGFKANAKPTDDRLLWRKEAMRVAFVSDTQTINFNGSFTKHLIKHCSRCLIKPPLQQII